MKLDIPTMDPTSNTLQVYRASAGSGKTFRLAVDYISLLMESAQDDEFKHILAVTFTNKATAEMKERILSQLYGIGHSLPSSEDYVKAVLETLQSRGVTMTSEALAHRARTLLSAILHDYHYFRVETIDSFFQSILRSLAHELGLNANLRVELSSKELISQAVDRIIEELTVEYDEVTQWILDFIHQKVESGNAWDVSKSLKDFAKEIYKEEFQQRTDQDRQALSDTTKVRAFRQQMNDIIDQEKADMKKECDAVIAKLDPLTNEFVDISHGKDWYRNFITSLQDKLDDFKEMSENLKKSMADPSNMLKKGDINDPDKLSMADTVAQEFAALYETYKQRFKRSYTAQVSIKFINELRMLGRIEEFVTQLSDESNSFLLSKAPILLSEMVKGADAPFVYEKAGIQFRHIMIDEFQDTSTLQWNNFKVLLFNNKSMGGRDLIVGDVKQSIYRWRGGDWRILHRFGDPKVGVPGAQMEKLNKNYRSMGNVIEFNNDFFLNASKMLDNACPEMKKQFSISDIYSDVKQYIGKDANKDKGYVRLHLYKKISKRSGSTESDNSEEYHIKIANELHEQIEKLHNDFSMPYSQMAIVVRIHQTGCDLIDLFKQIEQEDKNKPCIPLVSEEAYLLSASLAVKMIVAALYVLVDVQQKDDVNRRFLAIHYHQDVLRNDKSLASLAKEKYEDLLPEQFYKNKQELAMLPFYVLLERLYSIFSLDKLSGQGAYVSAFLDEATQYLQNGSAEIRPFLQLWEESLSKKSLPGGEMDGVRILTIHKSKGLEYDAVFFVPDMNWKIENDKMKNNDVMWCKTGKEEYDTLGLLPIKPNNKLLHSEHASTFELEHLDRRVDVLNMLYVAFTRAKFNLYVWGAYSDKNQLVQDSLACDLLKLYVLQKDTNLQADADELIWESGKPLWKASGSTDEEDNRLIAPKKTEVMEEFHSYIPHQSFFPSNATKSYLSNLLAEDSGTSSVQVWEVGIIVHRILSNIQHKGDVEMALEACERDGLIADEELSQLVRRRLEEGFRLPEVQRLFATDAEVFNECTIAAQNPENGSPIVRRPDRVVVKDDDIYLVDFKLGGDHEEYYSQVRGYKELLAQMYPSKRIHGYLWFILRGQVVEVD